MAARKLFKDPYLFDFLGTADPRREAEVEQPLVDHIQQFLLKLGAGFAFVGRQVHLEVGNDDFYLDLLFYHLKLRRYVVLELKARAFIPGDVGQIAISTAPPCTISSATRTTSPPSACCYAKGKTSSSWSMPPAAWSNPSPSPTGKRTSPRPSLPSSRAACPPLPRSRLSLPEKPAPRRPKMNKPFEEKMPRLVAERHAQFAESAKRECSAFHHSYFTLQSSTGGLGYGG